MQTANVVQRTVGPDSKNIGSYDDNPALNSVIYDVEFPDGTIKEYAANVIADNMLSQVDSKGYSVRLLDAIVDYQKTKHAVAKEDGNIVNQRGISRPRKTTKGWEILAR